MVLKWTFLSNAEVWAWYCHGLSASHHHNIWVSSWILSGILVLGNHLHLVHEETWPWKNLKEGCYPLHHHLPWQWHCPMPLQCGSFSCNMVRILVLPSGFVLLLMLATDFDLEMVENDCLRNSVPFEWSWKEAPWRSPLCCPWRSALSQWRSSVFFSMEVIWMVLKGGWLHAEGTFGHWVASRPGLMWLTFALASSGCAVGLSVPPSWLLGPTLGTEVIFIATLMTLFAPCWAFSRWVRHSTLTAYLTLTSGSLALTFPLLEGPDLIYCGWHCNSSIGLVIGSPWWLPHVAWHAAIICQRWLFHSELSVILPTFWLQSVWSCERVAPVSIASSLLVMCSHTSQLKSWCVDLSGQWFLVHPVWCCCTFHQCNSNGTLRLLECQWRPWTHYQGFSLHHHFWISQDVAIAWSLWCPGNQWCWHTIYLGGYWMLPMWGWHDSATPEMLSAGPLRASGMWVVGIWAVLPLCWK